MDDPVSSPGITAGAAHRRSAGFTLIELLVVISIIGLLVAILLPTLAAVRATARNIQCRSNIRQIGVATLLYVQDARDTFPGGDYDGNGDGVAANMLFHNLVGKQGSETTSPGAAPPEDRPLNHYMGGGDGTDAARCPSDTGVQFNPPGITSYDFRGSSYFYSDRLFALFSNTHCVGSGIWALEYVRLDHIRWPTRKVLFHEDAGELQRDIALPIHHWHDNSDPMRVNAAFADGHAAEIRRKIDAPVYQYFDTVDEVHAAVAGDEHY